MRELVPETKAWPVQFSILRKKNTREGKGWSACLLPEGMNIIQKLVCAEWFFFLVCSG